MEVRPASASQARRWNALNKGDLFWPIREWPNELARLALKDHLNNKERYFLFYFLAANGLAPDECADIVRLGRTFDDEGERHIQYIKQNWARYNLKYWDMTSLCYKQIE